VGGKTPADAQGGQAPGTPYRRAVSSGMGKPPAKKPPAPSVKKRAPPGLETNAQVVGEIYTAFQRLDADEELLAIVGS
jgi:hypothetical protein